MPNRKVSFDPKDVTSGRNIRPNESVSYPRAVHERPMRSISSLGAASPELQDDSSSQQLEVKGAEAGHVQKSDSSQSFDQSIEGFPVTKYALKLRLITKIRNKGSAARDHLANERTALAWIRTSLSFATIGVGIVQLYNILRTNHNIQGAITEHRHGLIKMYSRSLGSCFLILALICIAFGIYRYFTTQRKLERNEIEVARSSVLLIYLSTFILCVVVLSSVIQLQYS